MREMFCDLPNSWRLATLDVLSIVNPSASTNQLPESDDTLVNFVPMNAVQPEARGIDATGTRPYGEVRKGYTAFIEGDVLFAKITPCMENGKSVLVPSLQYGVGFGSTEFHVLRPRPGIVSKWIAHFVGQEEFRRMARQHMTGTAGQLRVPTPWLTSVEVPLAPAAEQTRIVAKLEELLSDLDAGVAELKAAQAKLGQYRQSLLKAAVDGSLTAEWRKKNKPKESGAQLLDRILKERRKRWEEKQLAKYREQGKAPPKGWEAAYPQPVKPDTKGLPELPKGWVWATLGQLLTGLASGSRDWSPYYDRGQCVFVMAQNVRPWRPDFSFQQFVDPPLGDRDRARSQVQKDDLLITIVGANTGQSCRIPTDLDSHFVCQSVALLRLVEADLSEFVNAVLNSDGHGQRQFREMNYGAGRPHLSFDQIESVAVPLPPVLEQIEILDQVSHGLALTEQLRADFDRTEAKSAAQRKNILKAAFSGQLVPQDPNDEPANVLLERIRAERAKGGVKGAKRGRKKEVAA